MASNKFIERLKGESTRKSVLEVKNEATKTSFANMPSGSSDALRVYDDSRGNATAVLKGTEIWKLQNNQLIAVTNAYGDGRDFTSTYTVSGNTTWVNAVYTLDRKMIFTGATKWVLKLCGHSLLSAISETIDFSLLIKFNNSPIITKSFMVKESAFEFCKEFIIDFNESEQTAIKMAEADTITVQLLCADATASATIYNGMTTLVAQQRRVDGEAVASDLNTFGDIEVEVAQLREDLDDLEEYVDDTFVRLDGTSVMTAPLKFLSGSMRGAVGPYLNGLSFWKMDAQGTITNIANLTDSRFLPVTTNAIDLGRSANKWKDLYLAGKAYMSVINNGYDIAVPVTNSADTLALKSEVDLAANSGSQLYTTGVWYAKMYAATVVPTGAEYDGRNYADFSQVDSDNNPVIKIYTGASGAWTLTETITPPADYNGYMTITSKIWDIAEQSGQQGGQVLWDYTHKTFTPYPRIVSFESINITGNSTVVMPASSGDNQIVNKKFVEDLITGSSDFDLFDTKWRDATTSNTRWALSDGEWKTKANAYQHLVDDVYGAPEFAVATQNIGNHTWYGLAHGGTKFVALGAGGYISTSTDGTTWTTATQNTDLGSKLWESIAYNGTKFVALSLIGYISTSTNGTTWTTATQNVDLGNHNWMALAYDGTKFVALSSGGYISTSTDGTTWTTATQNANLAGNEWLSIGWNGTKFVALSSDGYVSTSTDGTTWTTATRNANLGIIGYWYGLAYDGIKFVALSLGGYVSTSADGTTWTTATQNANLGNHNWYGLAHDGTKFVALGKTGYISTADAVVQTETIAGTTITYYAADDGHKIVLPDQESNVAAIYAATGVAWYYILDTENQRFKLPRKTNREIVAFQEPTAENNYTWYRLYNDGLVEQGGIITTDNSNNVKVQVVLPTAMANANYNVDILPLEQYSNWPNWYMGNTALRTTTGFEFWKEYANKFSWKVKGMAANTTDYDKKYLYFYVGA